MKKSLLIALLLCAAFVSKAQNGWFFGGSAGLGFRGYFMASGEAWVGYEFNDRVALGSGLGAVICAGRDDYFAITGIAEPFVRACVWHNESIFVDLYALGGFEFTDELKLCQVGLRPSLRFRVSENAVEYKQLPELEGLRVDYKDICAWKTPRGIAARLSGKGTADRSAIAAVKAAVSIPVIGNGDITSGQSAKEMLERTHCDGLMVGRGALGRPWIFREIKAALRGEPYAPPTVEERLRIALEHAERIEAKKGAHGLVELRKHLPRYLVGMRNAASLRVRLNAAKSVSEIRQLLLDSAKDATI